jgi:antitoxin ParD1/3/4
VGKIEKLSVALTAELAQSVHEAVDSGDYASASEVIREALRDWNEKQQQRAQSIARLRRLVEEGLASGVAEHYRTAEEIIRDGRRRVAESK